MAGQTSSNDFAAGAALRSSTVRPIASESTPSTPSSSLRTVVPSGKVMPTGGGASPATGGSTNSAR